MSNTICRNWFTTIVRNVACMAITLMVMVIDNPSIAYAQHNGDTVVVSLGDSYSAGEGCEPFYGKQSDSEQSASYYDWMAHRSQNSWPGQLSVDGGNSLLRDKKYPQKENGRWFFYAVSGALTNHIYNNNDDAWQSKDPAKHSEVKLHSQLSYANEALDSQSIKSGEVDVVTLSIGGNDLGFTTIVGVVSAATGKNGLIDRYFVKKSISDAWKNYNNYGRENICTAYRKIREAYPNADIIVAGYPTLMKSNYNVVEGASSIVNWILNRSNSSGISGLFETILSHEHSFLSKNARFDDWEAAKINETAKRLDEELSHLVATCGIDNITYVSVINNTSDSFLKHEIGTKTPYLHNLELRHKEDVENSGASFFISAYSVHPNTCGKSITEQNAAGVTSCCGVHAYVRAVQPVLDEILERRSQSTNSQQQTQQGSSNEITPSRSIAMVLDVSGSMDGLPIDETKVAAQRFVDNSSENKSNLGLVTFADSAHIACGIGSSSTTLKSTIDDLYSSGGTNIEAGLQYGLTMVYGEKSDKRIIVLMSDGEPTTGLSGEELIDYARSIRDSNGDGSEEVKIYTLGFNENASGQYLLAGIASAGCHYEVQDASDLTNFFADIADEIAGTRFIYARVACPVDVTVTYNGETLSSSTDQLQTRTSFGSLTFEEELLEGGYAIEDTSVKVLRLKEGVDYDIIITGYDEGSMDYSIGFLDDTGNYSDFREFPDVQVSSSSIIQTKAAVSKHTTMLIDDDGDGRIDHRLRASANQIAEEVDNSWVFWVVFSVISVIWILYVYAAFGRLLRDAISVQH